MSNRALAYLQVTSLETFIGELKRRGITEARLSDWVQRREMFERRKLRLTALDCGLIIRCEKVYYEGIEPELEKLKQSREEAKKRLLERLEAEGISVLEGEYHGGKSGW